MKPYEAEKSFTVGEKNTQLREGIKQEGKKTKVENVGQTIMTGNEDREITFLTKVWEGRCLRVRGAIADENLITLTMLVSKSRFRQFLPLFFS